jgi:hypothetical protein
MKTETAMYLSNNTQSCTVPIYTSHRIHGVPQRSEIPEQERLKKGTNIRYEQLHSLYENVSEVK